jgi:hypothetical protein
MPHHWQKLNQITRETGVHPECDTFVYATYLTPGNHQVVIYCPNTHRAFVKDFIVNLSRSDQYPEFPLPFKEENPKPKITILNVWRRWRSDTNDDKRIAF